MESSISVQKINTGLYRVLWHIHAENKYGGFVSDKADLTSLGVDECYEISYKRNRRSSCPPCLTLTLQTIDHTTDFKQRKVTARSPGYGQEMSFMATEQQADLQEEILWYSWKATWTDITRKDCSRDQISQCVAEYFEILIDMDPINSLEQGQRSILSNFSHLWESKTLADVTFRCEDKDIEAHKCIVSCGSPVLAAMFQNDFREQQEKIIEIKETKADVFENLLYFLYTGKLDLQFNDISALYSAADMYGIAALKKECEKYLLENITVENATTYLVLSYLHNSEKLYSATLRYMHKNSEAIVCSRPDDWMSFNKNYPELGVAAVQFMVKKNVDQKCRYLFEAEMYEELNKKMLEELMSGYESES